MIIIRNNNFLIPKKIITISQRRNKTYQETLQIIYRLLLQNFRRPSNLIISIIQPLLWLLLFGSLFQNAPVYLFEKYDIKYKEFLHPGIVIFTSFNNAINSGLPIIFDREFGFFNRIMISPIMNKNSVMYSSIIHTWFTSIIQVLIIIIIPLIQQENSINLNLHSVIFQLFINTIVISNISIISICNALILPGHIEFIAFTTLLINLPTLFTSTALAPLSFMPTWLQIICCINPLTYAIEAIRSGLLKNNYPINDNIIQIGFVMISLKQSIFILLILNLLSFMLTRKIIKYKYD